MIDDLARLREWWKKNQNLDDYENSKARIICPILLVICTAVDAFLWILADKTQGLYSSLGAILLLFIWIALFLIVISYYLREHFKITLGVLLCICLVLGSIFLASWLEKGREYEREVQKINATMDIRQDINKNPGKEWSEFSSEFNRLTYSDYLGNEERWQSLQPYWAPVQQNWSERGLDVTWKQVTEVKNRKATMNGFLISTLLNNLTIKNSLTKPKTDNFIFTAALLLLTTVVFIIAILLNEIHTPKAIVWLLYLASLPALIVFGYLFLHMWSIQHEETRRLLGMPPADVSLAYSNESGSLNEVVNSFCE